MIQKIKRKLLQIIIRGARLARIDSLFVRCDWVKPCVIAMVDGGLASQMWQFSLGYAAAKKAGLPLYLDTTWFENCGVDLNGVRNRYFLLLEAFPAVAEYLAGRITTTDKINPWFMRFFSDSTKSRDLFDYSDDTLPARSVRLGQYYCNCRYIQAHQQQLSELFSINPRLSPYEKELADIINQTCSCALHIRKGDFVGSVHDVCSEGYYTEAMKEMLRRHPNVHFIVFTNNEAWARDFVARVGYANRCTVIENRTEENPVVDLWLMQQCKHAIISNSGFSFMPAFLSYSPEKTVITPEYWLRDENGSLRTDSKGVYLMKGWLSVEN